jgi:hypothetical protein
MSMILSLVFRSTSAYLDRRTLPSVLLPKNKHQYPEIKDLVLVYTTKYTERIEHLMDNQPNE